MASVGVWLDHTRALVVRFTSGSVSVTWIRPRSLRPRSRADAAGRLRDSRQGPRGAGQLMALHRFYGEVIDQLGGAETIALAGPGSSPGVLFRQIARRRPELVSALLPVHRLAYRGEQGLVEALAEITGEQESPPGRERAGAPSPR